MNNQKKNVYLDHAATTAMDPRVIEAMTPFWRENFANPSTIYSIGREAKTALNKARETVAEILHSPDPNHIIFTGSGTESDNLAILGAARAVGKGHIITTQIEHHAVLNACKQLAKEGFEITYLPVDRDGLVNVEQVITAVKPETVLVSIMYANNEIGTVQPIAEIGERLKKEHQRVYFHTDACQCPGLLPLDVQKMNVDMLTINGSKIYGPKGVGVLYAKPSVKLQPLVFGGGQEKKLRSGTENVAAIVGLAKALEIAEEEREKEVQRLTELRDGLIAGIIERVPKTRLNGHPTKRLANNVNVTILDIEGEAMLLYLDEAGVYGSTGSACDSGTLDPSHVILALGLPYEYAHGSLRLTIGRENTEEDVNYVLDVLPGIVEKLRAISPLNLDFAEVETNLSSISSKVEK